MSFRFRRSVKIAPGIRLNFSRSGVSTTWGPRGLSVNTGRRGTFLNAGIPGTGIHARSRIGGGGRRGSAALGSTGNELAGCFGCGGAGFLLLLFIGFCGSLVSGGGHGGYGSGSGSYPPSLSTADTSYYSTSQQRETLYAYGKVNVRSGPGGSHAVARTLARGDRIEVGEADARGWAPAWDGYGQRIGYVYRAGKRLRPYEPPVENEPAPRRERGNPGGATAICRDRSYSYSAHHRGTCSHHGGVAQWL